MSPIPGTRTSDPGTTSAAQTGNAAEDGSRGTATACLLNSGCPLSAMARRPPSSPTSSTAPNPASIRSVWSRVASASITTVSPGAPSPASSTALLTCALATGSA